jgi:hypothetical protein
MGVELNPWLARISKRSPGEDTERGSTVGTGFITVFPWLVTCNHVLTSCIKGKNSSDKIEPGECIDVVVDFPFRPELKCKLFGVSVVASVPRNKIQEYTTIDDIAILELHCINGEDSGLEGWASPWKYEDSIGAYTELAILIKGFHIEKGDELCGDTKTDQTDGRISIEFEKVDESIKGASGAPVWSRGEQAIIGMLATQRGEQAETFTFERAYMIPMYKVINACEDHRQALLEYKEDRLDFESGNPEDFRAEAEQELSRLLNTRPMLGLLENFLKKQHWNKDDLSVQLLTEKMLKQCPHNTPKLFRNLSISVRKCLEQLEREERYKDAKGLIDDMKRVIAILSLYSIKIQDAERLRQNVMYSTSSLNMTIKHDNLTSAELVSATRMQAIPQYKRHVKRPLVQGRYAVSHFDLEDGIGKNGTWIDAIGKRVWTTFFPGYSESSYNRRDLRDHIRRELGADDPEKKNCYLVVSVNPRDKNESLLLDAGYRSKFTQAFPELPIILLDNSTDESGIYITTDRDLMVELYKFHEVIEKYDTTAASSPVGQTEC